MYERVLLIILKMAAFYLDVPGQEALVLCRPAHCHYLLGNINGTEP